MTTVPPLEMTAAENTASPSQADCRRFAVVAAPLLALSVLLAFQSDGVYHDDDLTHFLKARWAWNEPTNLIDVWGRPGFTVPYAMVAWVGNFEIGWLVCRLLTVAVVGATAWFSGDVARRLRMPQPEVAALVFLAMPLSFHLSYTTLTESICGLYLIAGTWLLIADRRWQSALVWSIAMTTRHEAVVYLVPVGLYFLWRRDVVAALLLVWAEVVWNAIAWAANYWNMPWKRYVEGSGAHGYGSGDVLKGIRMWTEAVGPGLGVLVLIGSGVLLVELWRKVYSRQTRTSDGTLPPTQSDGSTLATSGTAADPSRREEAVICSAGRVSWPVRQTLIRPIFAMLRTGQETRPANNHTLEASRQAAICQTAGLLIAVGGGLGTVALQTILYMFNRYASGGYARFLVPAAPWMAICAAAGLVRLWSMASATTPAELASNRSGGRSCAVHLGIALVAGALLATRLESLRRLYVEPTLLFSLTAVAVVAIALVALRLRWPVATVYLLLLAACGTAWGLEVKPLRTTPNQRLAAEMVGWWRNSPEYRGRQVVTTSIWFQYFAEQTSGGWAPNSWPPAPAGTLLVYDSNYGPEHLPQSLLDQFPSRIVRTWMSADPSDPPDKPHLVLFEKLPPPDRDSNAAGDGN